MNKMHLRSSNSGAPFIGNADGQTVIWDNTAKSWYVGFGAGAPITPLTRVVYVDAARAGSLETGSVAEPFLTIQAAVDALSSGGTVLIADGNYAAEDVDIDGASTSLIAMGKSVEIKSLAFSQGNGEMVGIVVVETTTLSNCLLDLSRGQFGDITCSLGVTLSAAFTEIASLEDADDTCHFALTDVVVTGDVQAHELVLKQSSVDGELSMDGGGATLDADAFSMVALRASGATHSVSLGSLSLSDHPRSRLVFTVPALSADTADVTVAMANTKPGDTFDVAPVAPVLAGVGIIAAWCATAGQVTLRFFGTAEGGGSQTVDLNRNTNSL